MELLLVTARWPLSAVHEFLDDEIHYLAGAFDQVTVAPMRPTAGLQVALPDNVVVDSSLARHLVRFRRFSTPASRMAVGVVSAGQRNPVGKGFTRAELLSSDSRRAAWLRQCLIRRADSRSVMEWARDKQPPDLAYTFWLDAATAGLRAAWAHTPIVSRAHGGDLFAEAHGWSSIPYQREALSACDLTASVSQVGARYLRAKFPDRAPQIVVRTLGIRDLGAVAEPADTSAIRLLSVSSVDGNKRVDLIARVAAHLSCRGRWVQWTHIGAGPNLDQVRAFIAASPPNMQSRLLGQIPPSEVHRELLSGGYHAFLNLSLSEGAPVSLMEAQCVGIPVVATRVGGSPEVCPPELNELVCPDTDVQSIAAAVERAVVRDAGQRLARREHWSATYNQATTYQRWSQELNQMALSGAGDRT